MKNILFTCCFLFVAHNSELLSQEQFQLHIGQEHSENWSFIGAGTWEMEEHTLHITSNTITRTPYTTPSAIAFYNVRNFGSCEIRAEIKSTAAVDEERGDMLMIFGYQSPSQYYYVHLTGTTDSIHNGVFIVNNAGRKKIDYTEYAPTITDREWHTVRLVRDLAAGTIQLFMDRDDLPKMSFTDTTLGTGKVGFGSFNDTGEIKNVSVIQHTP